MHSTAKIAATTATAIQPRGALKTSAPASPPTRSASKAPSAKPPTPPIRPRSQVGVLHQRLRELDAATAGGVREDGEHETIRAAGLGVTVQKVVIHDLRDDTYFARIYLLQENELGKSLAEVDSRPSDAIAVAVAFDPPLPIYVAESVLEEASP